MTRPGIMLYFDILEPLKVLPDADKGRLLTAILEYGQLGAIPEFDGMLAMAWGFIKPKLDRDGTAYEKAISQRKYAAFIKKLKAQGREKIEMEEWQALSDDDRKRMVTPVDERNPTTTVSPSTNTKISISPSSTSSPSSASSPTPTETAIPETTGGNFAAPDPGVDFEEKRRQAINSLVAYNQGEEYGR